MSSTVMQTNTTNNAGIYVGMIQKEAYADKDLLDLFTLADKNGDRVIDESEIKRFNGPILMENINNNACRYFDSYASLYSEGRIVDGIIPEYFAEYYPGLKVEDLDDKASMSIFRKLDLNLDGELSPEEMKYNLETSEQVESIEEEFRSKNKKLNTYAFIGLGIGVIGGCLAYGVLLTALVPGLIFAAGGAIYLAASSKTVDNDEIANKEIANLIETRAQEYNEDKQESKNLEVVSTENK